FRAAYRDVGESTLIVDGDAIEAMTSLPRDVYSHLNSFATIEIPFEATIAFGPIATAFPIEPADYPSGRPIKLAYLDEAGLHVVRASDAEKGPFEELGSGPLRRGEPLRIELGPLAGAPGCRLVFEDWSAQASMAPSPTAGWGVSQSSVQFFSRYVLMTLADTGPGRGFDSVGHAAGVYRNRVRVTQLP